VKNPKNNDVYSWGTRKELEFIERLGSIANEMASDASIKQCLQGYIKSSGLRDWVAAGIDGQKCIEAAKRRLKEDDANK